MEQEKQAMVNSLQEFMENAQGLRTGQFQGIVKTMRKHFKKFDWADLDPWVEQEADWAYHLVNGEISGVQVILLDESGNGKMVPSVYEQDFTLIRVDFNTHPMDAMELAEFLIRVFYYFDCTGCCDAIEFMRLNRGGLLISINSSRTYHS